jgi:hypothetical protein
MTMDLLKFFESSLKANAKWVLFDEALQAHELEVLRKILKTQKRDFVFEEIKADGVSADLEAAFSSLDFFSTAKVFYIHVASKAKWDDLADKRWQRLLELSDSAGNWLLVSAEDTKKFKAPLVVTTTTSSPEAWLKFFNTFLSPTGTPLLDQKKLDFLLGQMVESYLDYMHWIELWNLGGDAWAEHALGWGNGEQINVPLSSGNPAYAWVDAALSGRRDLFLKLSQELIENKGEDPLRLWGLLGKSIKICAQLGMGENVTGEAPFMITKLKHVKFRPQLLDWWCRCDLAMKGSRADVMGLISQIP